MRKFILLALTVLMSVGCGDNTALECLNVINGTKYVVTLKSKKPKEFTYNLIKVGGMDWYYYSYSDTTDFNIGDTLVITVKAINRQADALLMADIKPTLKMRRININNSEELKKFKAETSGFVSTYGFPYRLDDLTEKGANYTIFCPLRWKSAFSPAKLHKLLREDVDADVIKVEYIDFVKEEIEDKREKVWNVDYF